MNISLILQETCFLIIFHFLAGRVSHPDADQQIIAGTVSERRLIQS